MLRLIDDMARGNWPGLIKSVYGIPAMRAALARLVRNPTASGRYRKVEPRDGISDTTYRVTDNGEVLCLRRGRWTPIQGRLKGVYVKV